MNYTFTNNTHTKTTVEDLICPNHQSLKIQKAQVPFKALYATDLLLSWQCNTRHQFPQKPHMEYNIHSPANGMYINDLNETDILELRYLYRSTYTPLNIIQHQNPSPQITTNICIQTATNRNNTAEINNTQSCYNYFNHN